jgi:basic membrane lipoprotein Med (substrate-binding protein (PBP1-ABC) superfamily)
VEHGALGGPRHPAGQGRQVRGRGLRHLLDHEVQGLELAPLGTFEKKVPADVVAKVKAKEKAILAGSFTVKVDDSQPKSSAQ